MGVESWYEGAAAIKEYSDRPAAGSASRLPYIAALIALPLLSLALNDNWLFPTPGWIDPWLYAGYHLHLSDLSRSYPNVYYVTRVSWTVLGWLVHEIAGPVTSLYILGLFQFYVATFSLFFAIDLVFKNPLAAFISACLLGANSWFLWAIGWQYIDGPGLAYLLLSFAALAGTLYGRNWRLAAVLWGAAIAVAVTVLILMVLFIPIELVVFALLNRGASRRPLAQVAILTCIGLAGAMLAMGVISWMTGGNFLYLLPQITVAPEVAGNRFRYYMPVERWAAMAPWLLVPAFAMVSSAALLFIRRRSFARWMTAASAQESGKDEFKILVLCLACAMATVGYMVTEAIHFYFLQIFYRANSLLPFDYLVIGGLFAIATRSSPKWHRLGIGGLAFLLSLAPWLLGRAGVSLLVGQPLRTEYLTPPPTLLPAAQAIASGPFTEIAWVVVGSGILIGLFTLRRFAVSVITLAFLSVASVAAISSDNPMTFALDGYSKDATLAIYSASRYIETYNHDTRSRFWYNSRDRYGPIFTSINSTYLYAYAQVNDNFPSLSDARGHAATIAAGDRLVLLGEHGDDALAEASAAIAGLHLRLSPVARTSITSGSVAFDLLVVDVSG